MTSTARLDVEITSTSQVLLDALLSGDTDALTTLVAADCQIIGPKGYHIGTQDWIDTHSAQVYQQVLLETLESDTRVHGDCVVRSDLQRSECIYRGEAITGIFRVLSVWVRPQTRWQLAAMQYTAVAPDAQPTDGVSAAPAPADATSADTRGGEA